MSPQRFEPIAMTLREVADALRMGKSSVGRLVASGQLTAFRLQDGGTWRVLRSDFDAYIDARLAATRAEYERARMRSDG